MPARPQTAILFAVMLFAGCPRPTVDVPEEKGEPGEFCVTQTDCESGLSCLERSCCKNPSCDQMCSSLMEKDGTASKAALGHHPTTDRFFRRRCVSLCCEGADSSRIEEVMGAWSGQISSHGGLQINAP
ncbi:MAG: hypothetical protein ACI9WU_004785 [Myxococcota bacterium]|jgi:hypothetical protein